MLGRLLHEDNVFATRKRSVFQNHLVVGEGDHKLIENVFIVLQSRPEILLA